LSQLDGQIHHAVPLYLAGGSDEANLVRAVGDAKIAETAHGALHEMIDRLEITQYADNLKVSLRAQDLQQEFPEDVLKIMIGVVWADGNIDYEETDLIYRPDLNEKGIP
jgi:hypothetical protein